MKTFEMESCNLSSEFRYNLMEYHSMMWYQNKTTDWYRTVFFTIADVLKFTRSKQNPKSGFIIKDPDGNFKLGAIMMYHAPENGDNEDDDKGNYTLEFTFDENDMKDLDKVEDNHSDIFITAIEKRAQDIMYATVKNMESCNVLVCEAIDTLKKFLMNNASDTEDVCVECRGVFTATVTVEKDEKIISIEPGEMIKQAIKGDSTL